MTPALTAVQRRALLRSAAGHFAVAIVLALALTLSLAAMLGLGPDFVVKAVGIFMAGSLLFVPSLLRDHPFEQVGPANRITLARAVLTGVIAGFLGETVGRGPAFLIVGLGVMALLLDGLDGYLARRSGLASAFGARFDMEIDALAILLFGILAWQTGKAGPWVIASGLLRYLFVAASWALAWMRAALPYSVRRQAVCVIQIIVMLVVLLPSVSSPLSDLLAAVTLCLLSGSFILDVLWLARQRLPGAESADPAAKGS